MIKLSIEFPSISENRPRIYALFFSKCETETLNYRLLVSSMGIVVVVVVAFFVHFMTQNHQRFFFFETVLKSCLRTTSEILYFFVLL